MIGTFSLSCFTGWVLLGNLLADPPFIMESHHPKSSKNLVKMTFPPHLINLHPFFGIYILLQILQDHLCLNFLGSLTSFLNLAPNHARRFRRVKLGHIHLAGSSFYWLLQHLGYIYICVCVGYMYYKVYVCIIIIIIYIYKICRYSLDFFQEYSDQHLLNNPCILLGLVKVIQSAN